MRLLTWLFFTTLSAILLLQLRGLDTPLRSDTAPLGIVSYELAWSAPRASAIIDAWRSSDAIEPAKVSLGVDFVFLLAYPLFFLYSMRLLRRETPHVIDQLGRAAPWVLCCMPLDAGENLLLWHMLDAGASPWAAHLATVCATLKFLCVIAAAGWCVVAMAHRLRTRRVAGAA